MLMESLKNQLKVSVPWSTRFNYRKINGAYTINTEYRDVNLKYLKSEIQLLDSWVCEGIHTALQCTDIFGANETEIKRFALNENLSFLPAIKCFWFTRSRLETISKTVDAIPVLEKLNEDGEISLKSVRINKYALNLVLHFS